MVLEFSAFRDIRRVSQDRGEVQMAKLIAPYLFTWREVEARSDLERLGLVLEHLPDEGLMQKLEEQRNLVPKYGTGQWCDGTLPRL